MEGLSLSNARIRRGSSASLCEHHHKSLGLRIGLWLDSPNLLPYLALLDALRAICAVMRYLVPSFRPGVLYSLCSQDQDQDDRARLPAVDGCRAARVSLRQGYSHGTPRNGGPRTAQAGAGSSGASRSSYTTPDGDAGVIRSARGRWGGRSGGGGPRCRRGSGPPGAGGRGRASAPPRP